MKIILSILVSFLLIGFTGMEAIADSGNSNKSYIPPSGFVPTSEVAVKIAEAVLFPIYGKAEIEAQRPYQISEVGADWVIQGTVQPNRLGGNFLIKISKSDGRVRLVTHSR